jgi:imidazolonepropionase-like amidohydrolase
MIDGYDHFLLPFVRALQAKGGRLLAGTDAPVPSTLPASALHQELEELVRAGLTPYEALKASTTNPYEFSGEMGRGGTIEAGKAADLVLLEGDPLESISNVRRIAGVMRQGRWIPREEIDRRLDQIRSAYRNLGERKQAW